MIRFASLLEIPEALQLLLENSEHNGLDLRIFQYPVTRVVRSENGNGADAYMAVQTVPMLESIGYTRSLEPERRKAVALEMVDFVEQEARKGGMGEVYFVSSDPKTDARAMKERGFEPVTAFRKRLT